MGVFENIHGAKGPGEFAEQLGRATLAYVGAPFNTYMDTLLGLLAENPTLPSGLAEQRDQFLRDNLPEGASGQVRSVCGRFGVLAMAGELATEMGVTGWPAGETTAAIMTCFRAWLDRRRSIGDHDIEEGIEQVIAFIEKHGSSRFETIYTGQVESYVNTTYNRVGYRKFVIEHADADKTSGDWHYYVLPQQWKNEICRGFDPRGIAQALSARGYLLRSEKGKLTSKLLTPDGPRIPTYHLSPRLFSQGE
jgi:putative DNA primase/helicase